MNRLSKLFTLAIILMMVACSAEDETLPMSNQEATDGKVALLTIEEDTTTWTDHTTCIINGSAEVEAPWNQIAVTSIPYDIRKDVEAKDGWNVLFSTVQIKGYKKNYNYHKLAENANYILFYNKYSGVLKGFCYIATDLAQNNCGVWQLSVNGTTRLFDFTDEYATPYDGEQKHCIYTTSITDEGKAGGFTRGWNCFMVELAYDENSMSQILNIAGISLDQASYDFSGTLMFNTSGTYVTTSQTLTGRLIQGVASVAGEGTKNIITKWENDRKKTTTRSAIGSLAAMGVKELVSNGLNKIFKSISGSTKKNYNDINLKSSGNATVTGTSQQPSSGIVPPLSGIALNSLGYNLGVWNVSSPKIEIAKHWHFDGDRQIGIGHTYYYYTVKARSTYKIVINPILSTYSRSSNMLYSQFWLNNGFLTEDIGEKNKIEGSNLNNFPSSFRIMTDNVLPNSRTSGKTEQAVLEWERTNISPYFNGELSIVHVVKSPNDKFYSAHTYKIDKLTPNNFLYDNVRPYWWTYEELNKNGYIK